MGYVSPSKCKPGYKAGQRWASKIPWISPNQRENKNWVWWLKPVVSALGKMKQEDHQFKPSLGEIRRSHFKIKGRGRPHIGLCLVWVGDLRDCREEM